MEPVLRGSRPSSEQDTGTWGTLSKPGLGLEPAVVPCLLLRISAISVSTAHTEAAGMQLLTYSGQSLLWTVPRDYRVT